MSTLEAAAMGLALAFCVNVVLRILGSIGGAISEARFEARLERERAARQKQTATRQAAKA